MRIPNFLPTSGCIGVVAPSLGVDGYPYTVRYENAIKKFKALGYKIKECEHLYGITKAASSTAINRANDFMKMYLDDEVDFIFSVAGGEIMIEILPYIDFELLKQAKPKYFMGYSDNTVLTFTLPLLSNVVAIYGSCIGSFGMEKWHQSLQEAYEIIIGKRDSQSQYDKYEIEDLTSVEPHGLDGYNLTEKVEYKSLRNKDEHFSGRLIGGCLDVLGLLGNVNKLKLEERILENSQDGFIWFLEACELNTVAQKRILWLLKSNGWFKHNCKGILYGRPYTNFELFDVTLDDVLHEIFDEYDIPVIYGCDIGHVPPQWTLISGSMATFDYHDGEGTIKYLFK